MFRMPNMKHTIQPCTDGDADIITDRLVAYNLSQVPAEQSELFCPIERKIVAPDGSLIAGCLAVVYCWNIAFIDILWVDESYRKQGLGRELLRAVEGEAREKGCRLVHLDTFDFQGKAFYEKNGYTVFGTLEDCPKGHCRYYMSKML